MSDRPHPFALVFGGVADTALPAIRAAVGDAPTRDVFLMAEPVIRLLAEFRPDDGLGEAVDDFVAFIHAGYRFWAAGATTRTLDATDTLALCAADAPAGTATDDDGGARYIQVAPRLLWGRLADGETFEPLDGWFVWRDGAALQVVAVFGVHHARPGLTVVAAEGVPGAATPRADGSAPFAPQMTGGDLAGLHSVADHDELLLLGWRAETLREARGWR